MSNIGSPSPVAQISFEDKSTDPPRTGIVQVFPSQTIKFGRDPNKEKNTIVFSDPAVSRNHAEIYSVMIDDDCRHTPLVFVRDRQSFNGTYVNRQLVGKGPNVTPGRLLQGGDIISISPLVTFRFTQTQTASPLFSLSSRQRREVSLFADKYTITDRTIGDGAHALVHLATETTTGKQLGCKIHNLGNGPRSIQRLQRIRQEVILLSYLDHPNILSVKAAFQTHQSIYIFTELATGGDLFSLFTRYQAFEGLEIRWIIWQVLRGIGYLHSKGVAHRDIKPENILCAIAPDAAHRIILSDFGDSAIASSGRLRSEVGTSFYRAPECHTPEHGHGLSVDVWAVGMLTMQLFAGSQELPEARRIILGSQENVNEYVEEVFHVINPLGEISAHGRAFISGCLTYDSELRLTAREAMKHDWLQKPGHDRKLFRRRELECISYWSPRGMMLPVIEDLTVESEAIAGHGAESAVPTSTNTVSPHFRAQEQFLPADTSAHRHSSISQGHTEKKAQGQGQKPRREFKALSPVSLRAALKSIRTPAKRKSIPKGGEASKRRRIYSL